VKQVVIENPVINCPFKEPNRHFRFTEEDITDEIVETRRVIICFIPIVRTLWVPAVNNHDGFGTWSFLEITDPWDAKNTMLSYMKNIEGST